MNLADYLTPQTSAWLVASLAHVLWQGTLAAAMAALAGAALRKRDARARYAVYGAALGLTAACLPLNLWLTAPDAATQPPAVASTAPDHSPAGAIAPVDVDHAPRAVDGSPETLAAPASLPEAVPPVSTAVPDTPTPTWESASPWIVTAYLVGAAAMGFRLLLGLYGCQRLRATARPIEESRLPELLARIGERLRLEVLPVVAYSHRVATPVVVGVVKPAILLPAAILNQLTIEQVESLLLHELAHIRRYDHLVNLLQRVVEAALFFHPAVWWLSHKIGVEREHCCDDLAIRWGSEPCDYAESLVRLSELRYQTAGLSTAGAAALAATGPRASQLRSRVLRVLGMPLPGPSVGLTRVGVASVLMVALTSAVLLAALPEESNRSEDVAADGLSETEHIAAIKDVLRELASSGRQGDFRQFVDLLPDDEVEVMAGLSLQGAVVLTAAHQMGGEKASGESLAAENQQVVDLLSRFTKKSPPTEAEAAVQRLAEFTLQGVFGGAIGIEDAASAGPNTSETEFRELLRQSSGLLTDPRAFLAASLRLSNNQPAAPVDAIVAADEWAIDVAGDQATAASRQTGAGRAGAEHKINLQRADGEWRISSLNLKLTNWPGVVGDAHKESPTADPRPRDAASSALLARLQGEWRVEARDTDEAKAMIAHVEGNQIRLCKPNGEDPMSFDFSLAEGDPHFNIDLKPRYSAAQRQAILAEIEFDPELTPLVLALNGFPGIIEATKDGFRICLRGAPDGERPMLLAVNESQGLWELRRPSEAAEAPTGDGSAAPPQNGPVIALREWIELAIAGNDDAAAEFVAPGEPNQAGDLREIAGANELRFAEGYATDQAAIVVTTPIKSKRGRAGVLVFRLHRSEDQWLIKDIDWEDATEAAAQMEGFLGHPNVSTLAVEEPGKEASPLAATLSGRIVLEDGAPATVEGQMYYDTRYANNNGASGTEDRYVDRFSFNVGAGTTWLTYYAEGYAPAWTEQLELAPGERRDDVKLVLRPGVSQRVRVVNEQGEPIPGATVAAYPEIHGQSGGPIREDETDQQGEHVLQHLAATRYAFNVEAAGYEPIRGRLLELQPESTIALELQAAATTTGVVRRPDGKPLVGAKIRLIHEASKSGPDRGFSDSRRYSWWGEDYAATDDRGAFALDRLRRGYRYLGVIEAADGARVVYHGLEAGQSLDIVVPQRRDLVVNLTGDLSRLKKGRWDPRVSVRQRVKFVPWPKETVGELLGGDVVIEPTPTGGRAVLRGVAIDLNVSTEEQEVEVYLPGNEGYRQTVRLEPRGNTVVEIAIADDEPAETDVGPTEEQPVSANAADGPTPDSLVRTALEQLSEAANSIRAARLEVNVFNQGPFFIPAGTSPDDLAGLVVDHDLVSAPDALADFLEAAAATTELPRPPWSQVEVYLQMSDGRPTQIRESMTWPGRDEPDVHIQTGEVAILWDPVNSQLNLAARADHRIATTTLRDVWPSIGFEFLDRAPNVPVHRTTHRGSPSLVTSTADGAVMLYFDAASGLPIELVRRRGATERRSQWLGWRRQSGVPVPTLVTEFESLEGVVNRVSILHVGLARFNTPLPESVFLLGAPAGSTIVDERNGHSVRRLQRDVFDVTSQEQVEAAIKPRRRELTETEQRAVDELRQAYVLADGEVLKRFGPPYPLARNYLRHLLRPGSAPGRQEFFYFLKWQDGKPEHHFGIGGRAPKLADLTTYLLGQPSVDVDIAEELLTLPLPGDYLFRADATREQLAEALSQLVSDELGRPVRLVFEQVERPVYVASGALALNQEETMRQSIRGEDQAVITVNSGGYLGDHGEQISFGDLPKLLADLGEYIGIKVLDETTPSSERLTWSKRWYDTYTVPKEKRFQIDPDTVLQAVTAQTGVEFEKSSSPVTILRVRDE